MNPSLKESISVGNKIQKNFSPELQAFGKNIWIVDGPNVRDMFITFTTRMTIVKLVDGSLWVNSPVPVQFDLLKQITALGTLKYLLAATPRHVWRLDGWHTLFPEAQLWAPQKSPFTLKKGHLSFSGILGDEPFDGWAYDFDQLVFKGNPLISEVFFYHRASNTVIVDDLIQIHQIIKGRPYLNALIKLEGVASPYGGVGLDLRLSFTNRNKARQSLKKLLSWDFDKLIIAHGICIEKDAKSFVEKAFYWLSH
jgi:hypothetical protein